MSQYVHKRNDQALYDANSIMTQSILNSFQYKIGSTRANYISPQEIASSLPSQLRIDRDRHIAKHHSGQWEIRNKHIHCFFGFQVTETRYSDTKSILKDLIRANSEQYRYDNYIDDGKDYTNGDCAVCGNEAKIDHRFNEHICTVKGHFKCYNYYCNGHTFSVGICLLNPYTLRPPTRYKCANCGNHARFIRYSLKQKQLQNDGGVNDKDHRRDLCEACGIWYDCRLIFVQPSAIQQALRLPQYRAKCVWKWNKYGDGIIGSFTVTNANDGYHEFQLSPYVNCVYMNSQILYTKQRHNFSPDLKHRYNQKRGQSERMRYSQNKKKNVKNANKRQTTQNTKKQNKNKKKKNAKKKNTGQNMKKQNVKTNAKKNKKRKTK